MCTAIHTSCSFPGEADDRMKVSDVDGQATGGQVSLFIMNLSCADPRAQFLERE